MSKIKKAKENQIEVFEKDEQFWTTSLDVAEKFGKRHNDVVRAIKNLELPDDFQLRNFAYLTRKIPGGTQEYYIISRDGFSLLAMGFTGKEAIQWKIKYIEAFNQMEKTIIAQAKQLRREANREWKQLREDGKMDRRTATDAEKRFVDYAVSRGSSLPPKRWFSLLAEAKYDAIIIPGGHMEIRRRKKESAGKNGVDVLTSEELKKNSMIDLITGRIVDEALVNNEDHHKIFKLITENFKQYGNMFNAMFLPSPFKSLTLSA